MAITREPLTHATTAERQRYAAWLLTLAKKARSPLADYLRQAAERALNPGGSFYA